MDAFDFSTNMDSSYKVKVEGRLLEDDDELDDSDDEGVGSFDAADVEVMEDAKEERPKVAKSGQRYRFSHFFKSMTVDFERNRSKDGTEYNVEWKKPSIPPNAANPPNAADFDQLEFKRGGDENINIKINLVRDEAQERFVLSPALAEIMDTTEATRAEAVTCIWEYIKIMGLQEDDEKRSFRCDDVLKTVSNALSPHLFDTYRSKDLSTRYWLHPVRSRHNNPTFVSIATYPTQVHDSCRSGLPQRSSAYHL